MISRIDHVSIAVRENDYERAVHFFQDVLGAIPGVGLDDERLKFFWHIYSLGDLSRLEIMKPTAGGSFLDGFLRDTPGGVHHLTLETPDIEKAKILLDEHHIPWFGFHDLGELWKELFIHPKHAFGVLIQIAQFTPDDWLSRSVKFPGDKKCKVTKTKGGCVLAIRHPGGGKAHIAISKEEAQGLMEELRKV